MTQRDGQIPRSSGDWLGSVGRRFTAVVSSSIIVPLDRRLVRMRLYRADSRPLGKLQSSLAAWAFVTFVLLLLNGAMELWEDGGGRGSLAVGILGWIVWIVYTLARVILIGVVLGALHQWSVSRQRPSVRS